MGIATCDKGLPAMMMALAAQKSLPCIIVPGGVTLLPEQGEDAGKVQSLGARFSHGLLTLEEAAELGCRACASPGGGCQFLGTAATSQVVAEALGLAVTHSALAPSGQPIWLEMAERSARALVEMAAQKITLSDILTPDALHNAMVTHAAFGGSTNLLLHIPAIAHAANLPRPGVEDWARINRQTPRLVDVLPNGPVGYGTVQVFLAGGVPEVMLHLRDLGLLHLEARTVNGNTLGECLEIWEHSQRRRILRQRLEALDGVHPDEVIMSPTQARQRGLTSTITFLTGNLAPQGAVIKSTAIDPSVVDADGVYRKTGPARVFTSERAAIAAVKGLTDQPVKAGDVIVLIGCGPLGTGMEETYQLTAALRHLPEGKTDCLDYRCAFQRGEHRRVHRSRGPRSAGRRPDWPRARWRHHSHPRRSSQPCGANRSDRRGGAGASTHRERRRKSWRRARLIPICSPIRICRMIPACGRRSRISAAARGAAVCMMWMKSSSA